MKYLLPLLLSCFATPLFAQSATYQMINKTNGDYSHIAIRQRGTRLEVNILASWDKERKFGEFNGEGVLVKNKCIITADSSSCKVAMVIGHDKIEVSFNDCPEDLIPDEFAGSYHKIADNIRGEYIVTAEVSYFYSKPDERSRRKGFTNKAQLVNIEELFSGNWGFATFMAKGKQNFGYIKLSDLKLKKTYLYDN